MRGSNRSPPPPYSPLPQPTPHGVCDAHGVRCHCMGTRPRTAPMEPLQQEDASHHLIYSHSMADQPLWHPPPSTSWGVDRFNHVCSPVVGEALESTTNLTDDQLARGCGHQVQLQSQQSSCNFSQPTNGNLSNRARWYRKYCNHQVPAVVVFGVVAAVFSVTYLYMVVVYRLQPSPIVDEAFHIPQAQKYCQGKFNEWDPKLTTLPGLYLFSIGITGPISWLLGNSPQKGGPDQGDLSFDPSLSEPADDNVMPAKGIIDSSEEGVCSVLMLRLVNVVVAPCTLLALHSLMCFMHGIQCSEWSCLAASVSLVLLPPLFWFYSLYYTEPLSTMLVLLMLLLYCHHNHSMAAAIGGVSILARQTNVVWVCFLLMLRGTDCVLGLLGPPPLPTLHSLDHCKVLGRRLQRLAQEGPTVVLSFALRVVGACAPYLLLVGAFGAFVWANGGLVVGDRSAHEATLHLMQVFYFCLFYLLFSPMLALNNVPKFLALCCRHPKTTCFILITTLCVVHKNTLVHPYLLADNRHYTFYLWNRFYGRHIYFRYVMAPVYMYGGHLIWNVSLERRSNVFRCIYAACVALSVVPQRLLEPRYFILPFLIARMQKSPSFGADADGGSDGTRGNPARGSSRIVDGFRGNNARCGPRPGGGNLARSSGSRSSQARGLLRHVHSCMSITWAGWRHVRQKLQHVGRYMPVAHIGWEFLYYLTINLATLAVFGTKTFWWKDFAEPQRIMW